MITRRRIGRYHVCRISLHILICFSCTYGVYKPTVTSNDCFIWVIELSQYYYKIIQLIVMLRLKHFKRKAFSYLTKKTMYFLFVVVVVVT